MEKTFFYQPAKDNKVADENIRKIATGKGDDYTTGCLLDYPYFKDAYPRAKKQINFIANLATQESISFLKKQKKLS